MKRASFSQRGFKWGSERRSVKSPYERNEAVTLNVWVTVVVNSHTVNKPINVCVTCRQDHERCSLVSVCMWWPVCFSTSPFIPLLIREFCEPLPVSRSGPLLTETTVTNTRGALKGQLTQKNNHVLYDFVLWNIKRYLEKCLLNLEVSGV